MALGSSLTVSHGGRGLWRKVMGKILAHGQTTRGVKLHGPLITCNGTPSSDNADYDPQSTGVYILGINSTTKVATLYVCTTYVSSTSFTLTSIGSLTYA